SVALGLPNFVNLVFGVDYTVTSPSSGAITVQFLNTANVPNVSNYAQYRRIKYFNRFVNVLNSPNISLMSFVINETSMEKRPLAGMTVTNIVESTTANKQFTLNTGLSNSLMTDVLNGYF